MKITLPTKLLKESLARLATIPGAHGASIHTQAVGLSADLAGLTMRRFSSEANISVTIDEDIEVSDDDGTALVNHSALVSLVNACNAKAVELRTDDKFLHLQSGKAKWKLKIFDEDLMTEPPEPELETEHINILLEDLTDLLGYCLPAVSRDTAGSYAFCGVNIQSKKEGGLYFVATDSKRCHIAVAPYDLQVNVTIPTEGAEAILKAIGTSRGGATLAVSDTFATVTASSMEVSVTLLADPYPNVIQHFLGLNESSILSKVAVCRDELADALEACAKVNESDSRIVNMKVEKKLLEITGSNARDTEGGVTMDCTATAPFLAGVPGSGLAAALRKLKKSEDESIEFNQTERMVFLRQPERMAFFALAKPQ